MDARERFIRELAGDRFPVYRNADDARQHFVEQITGVEMNTDGFFQTPQGDVSRPPKPFGSILLEEDEENAVIS